MIIQERDRRLLYILPAVLILVLYVLYLSWNGKFTELRKAREETAKVEQAAPTPDVLRHQQLHVRQASADVEQANKLVETSRARFQESIRCADPVHRSERIHKLTMLLSSFGLVVIEHAEAENGKDNLPPSLTEFAKQLPIASPPKLHKIRFAARYPDARRLTEELSRDGSVAIPVGLTMKESPNETDWHEWLLLVWV